MMTNKQLYYASCAFGTESCVKFELGRLGAEYSHTSDGRVYFTADESSLARVCIGSRCADRIYMVLGEFTAVTFDELFEGIKRIDFGSIIPMNAAIPVAGDSVHSVLGSVSDIQSIAKKAVIESMKRHYGNVSFDESKKPFGIYVTIVMDKVTVALNMVGKGLSRRGYRVHNTAAPIKETLAASLISIARWYSHPFYDPMCGSGTIAIEAAMQAKNIMPGTKRHFDAMHFGMDFKRAFDSERQRAMDGVVKTDIPIFAYDVSGDQAELTRFHAERAGVDDAVTIEKRNIKDFSMPYETAVIITNPPYAVRLGTKDEADRTYEIMGRALMKYDGAKIFVICPDERFERKFGAKADKKRKLLNAGIKTYYYQYFRKRGDF